LHDPNKHVRPNQMIDRQALISHAFNFLCNCFL
jgi:hypothetical protein